MTGSEMGEAMEMAADDREEAQDALEEALDVIESMMDYPTLEAEALLRKHGRLP